MLDPRPIVPSNADVIGWKFVVTPEQDALIRQAADLEDTTVTAFVLDIVTSRA